MRRRNPFFRLAAMLLVLLPAVAMQARVFRLTGGAGGGTGFEVKALGQRAYRTSMRINGGQAEVSVLACREGNEGIRQMLESNRSSARNTACVFAPGEEGEVGLMVVVEQKDATPGLLRRVPARHEMRDVPLLPGSRVTSFMRNEQSLTTLETASSAVSLRGAVSFYQGTMKQAGWSQMFPVSDPDQDVLLCFVRGGDICLVQVGPLNSDGETQLTLLHKQGALK
jgi:hypothetical protein